MARNYLEKRYGSFFRKTKSIKFFELLTLKLGLTNEESDIVANSFSRKKEISDDMVRLKLMSWFPHDGDVLNKLIEIGDFVFENHKFSSILIYKKCYGLYEDISIFCNYESALNYSNFLKSYTTALAYNQFKSISAKDCYLLCNKIDTLYYYFEKRVLDFENQDYHFIYHYNNVLKLYWCSAILKEDLDKVRQIESSYIDFDLNYNVSKEKYNDAKNKLFRYNEQNYPGTSDSFSFRKMEGDFENYTKDIFVNLVLIQKFEMEKIRDTYSEPF